LPKSRSAKALSISSPIQPWIARPSRGGAPGSRSETAGGVFHIREDEPAPRVGAGLHRTP
jgi:hypothetical protein